MVSDFMITGFRLSRVLLGVLALATVSCQRVALLAPAGSTITLMTLETTVPLNGTAQIIAQVIGQAGPALEMAQAALARVDKKDANGAGPEKPKPQA